MNSLVTRRVLLGKAGAIAAAALLAKPMHGLAPQAAKPYRPSPEEDALLEQLTRRGCAFFWEQASPNTGQVLDRARAAGPEKRRMASIAATGFGLAALCIADSRGYYPHIQIVERVRRTLRFHWTTLPQVHGFYFHFSDAETGITARGSELSSIDTTLLLAGILAARAYFDDAEIKYLATKIYERIDWPWMLDEGRTLSMGWFPDRGFLSARWDTYSEEMMMYLLAIGSPTHPLSPDHWNYFARPKIKYDGIEYVSTAAPLFIHQYSHAFVDFRNKRDKYLDYFQNSVDATRAHKQFCINLGNPYGDHYWGITASDSMHGYTAWGGPPKMGRIDGSVVPCAAAGSLAFLPEDCLRLLSALQQRFPLAWGRYGFCDAFNPAAPWYDPDVLGIDLGIGVLMPENLRTGNVWANFMKNPEVGAAMRLCGFHRV